MSTSLAPPLPSWLDRSLYPFTPRRHETADGALSYLDEGEGPPIVFVHGTPSWSFEFRALVAALKNSHRCIAVDHLGFGLSDKPEEAPLTPEDHARRLRKLVEALDLREITLVVHDFGGPIGLPLALDTTRIARVVVLNSWMWPNDDDPAVVRLDRVLRSWLGRVLYRWLNASPRWLLPAAFADRRKLTASAHRHYLAPFSQRRVRAAPYALARALLGSNEFYRQLWSRRAELTQPLTLIWGMRDPAFQERHLARWLAAFPDAALIRLEQTGHFLAEECPELVLDALVSIVRSPMAEHAPGGHGAQGAASGG